MANNNYQLKFGSFTGNGTSQSITVGFQPDVVWIGNSTGLPSVSAVYKTSAMPATMSSKQASSGIFFTGSITAFTANGFSVGANADANDSGETMFWIAWKDKGGLAVSTYLGNSTDNRTITTGHSAIMVHVDGDANAPTALAPAWKTTTNIGEVSMLYVGNDLSTNAIQSFTGTGFVVGTHNSVNNSGVNYYYVSQEASSDNIATGRYTGNGSTQNITTVGFLPALVIIKRDGLTTGAYKSDNMTNTQHFNNSASVANGITAFIPTGFSVGSNASVNQNTNTYRYIAYRKLVTITKTINSNSYIKKLGTIKTLTSDSYILHPGAEGSVVSDALIKKTDNTETIISDAYISFLVTKTIASDSYIFDTSSKSIITESFIKVVGDEGTLVSSYYLKATSTKSVTSDYYLKATNQIALFQASWVLKIRQSILNGDADIKVLDNTETIDQDSWILVIETNTLDSNYYISKTYSETLSSDYYIKQTYTEILTSDAELNLPKIQTIVQDAYILKVTDQTLDCDAEIFILGDYFIVSNADIKTSYEQTITQDDYIKRIESGTIASDYYITVTFQEDIVSNYTIKASVAEIIYTDFYIKTTYLEVITSDAYIETVPENLINANYYIKKIDNIQTIAQDAEIFASTSQLILSDYYIHVLTTQTIDSNYSIFEESTTGITSDAHIVECGLWSDYWSVFTLSTITVNITCDYMVAGVGTIPQICDASYVNKPEIYDGSYVNKPEIYEAIK